MDHMRNLERHPDPQSSQHWSREAPKPKITGKMLAVLQEREGKAQHGWAGGGDREPPQGPADGSWQPVGTEGHVH